MRKILAGFMATSMIVAMASSVTFAATAPSVNFTTDALVITPTYDLGGKTIDGLTTGKDQLGVTAVIENVNVTFSDGSVVTIPVSEALPAQTVTVAGASVAAFTYDGGTAKELTLSAATTIKDKLAGKKFSSARIDDKIYSGKIVDNGAGNKLKIVLDGSTLGSITATGISLDVSVSYNYSGLKLEKSGADVPILSMSKGTFVKDGIAGGSVSVVAGNGADISDVEKSGDFFKSLGIKDVIWCDGNGAPMPMTEKSVGADKDLNDQGGVQSGKTLYFMINDSKIPSFADDTYWKLKITKGDNGKLIKKITDTTKIFSSQLVNANNGDPISNIDFTQRHRYIKVELNEIFTDDEYKLTLDLRMSPTSKAESKFASQGVDGSEIKVKDFYFWLKNIVKPADNDWKVGIGGLMLNPLENDWNEVTYYDEDGDLAFMKFFADSDVSKFYAKLSTKWEHADYASYFNDQDAYIFDFVGSPKISATSRCDLQIYNPFVDEDGNETIDPSTAVIYQVIDGDLFDVTDSFKYEEGDNGDMAFTTRTRFLGTYIICEKAVEEAADNTADVPTDLVPEDTTPSEVTPDNNNGGKAPANTGKYL